MKKKFSPSIQALEILAISDSTVFESILKKIGLQVEGVVNIDPLNKTAQNESVNAIASELTEDVNTCVDISPSTKAIKRMAEDYGYIVSIRENEDHDMNARCSHCRQVGQPIDGKCCECGAPVRTKDYSANRGLSKYPSDIDGPNFDN